MVIQAAVVGRTKAMGPMFNAFKEQTPLVFYSYRTDQSGRAGRDGFEEVANQEQIVQPMTKYSWLARRADMIPETVRRGFKAAWTPPHGPSYISWHSDFHDQKTYAQVINHGNKLQHNSPQPLVAREAKFIDMRIDSWSMGNVMNTEVPLVADVGYGLDDLTAAVEGLMTPTLKKKAQERAQEVRQFSEKAKALRA